MKLISLNIWGAHVHEPLLAFVQQHVDVEFFCLQEVYHQATEKISTDDRWVSLTALDDIHALLPTHRAYFQPVVGAHYGLATLVHSDITVLGTGSEWIYDRPDYPGYGANHPRLLQWLRCQRGEASPFVIVNVHGLWNGQGKTDTPQRLEQSRRLCHFLQGLTDPFVLCGDFNLRPDTESLRMIATGVPGLRDWIAETGVTSTRSVHYPKPEKFADYLFTSPGIDVAAFAVLSGEADQVSDHLPLWVELTQ